MTSREDASESRQNEFLDNLVGGSTPVSIFLINGIRLSGVITAYDSYIVLLQAPSGIQAIYKHAISTVLPNGSDTPARRPDPGTVKERSGIYRRNTTSY